MKTIYLTAGHEVINNKGTGAHGFIDEAVENIKLRDSIAKILKSKNIKVVTDNNVSKLREIISWLKKLVSSKDIVIDIHFNSSSNSKASGTEVIIDDTASDFEKKFAKDLVEIMASTLGIKNRGVKSESVTPHKRLAIISDPSIATNVLLEVCFVSNKKDVEAYKENYSELVAGLVKVIENYYN
jgi:N-acetylmuramoyl-L-alanine amidase